MLVVDAKRTSICQQLSNLITKILRYVSDAPNILIGGVNVFRVTVAVISHLQCPERRLIKCSPDIVTYFIKLHLLSCVPLSRQ
jgi:hypothetical protein